MPADLEPDPEAEDEDIEQSMGKFVASQIDASNTTRSNSPAMEEVNAVHEEAATADEWKDDKLSIEFNDLMLKAAQEKYENAKSIMSPGDPRMKKLDFALWTWILRVLGVIKKRENAPAVELILEQIATKKPWKDSVPSSSNRRSRI